MSGPITLPGSGTRSHAGAAARSPAQTNAVVSLFEAGSTESVESTPADDRLLSGLTVAQRSAVMADDAPLCVLAGAGSGKTTVLTRRVARRVRDGSAQAEHVLVVTFTRKAATELRGRLSRLGVPGGAWAGTIHAAAYAQLRRYWADHDVRPPTILDDPARLLRRIWQDSGSGARRRGPGSGTGGGGGGGGDGTGSSGPTSQVIAAVAGEIHWAQARMVAPADYSVEARAAGRTAPVTTAEVAEIYGRYEEEKKRRGLVDVDDLLDRCAHLIENDDAVAATQRWWVRHLFVDEFQDLNPSQWRLLRAWLGDRSDLFVVGDPRQAVYGWNGADPSLLERLPDLLAGTSVLRLDRNHRSSPQIVRAARALLPDDREDADDEKTSEADSLEAPPDGPQPVLGGFSSDETEAAAVCRWLRQAHRPGTSWSQLAVLARTNSRLEPIGAALRRAGIPHRLTSPSGRGSGPGTESVRNALKLLRAQPPDRLLRSALAELSADTRTDSVGGDSPVPLIGGDLTSSAIPPELERLADDHATNEPGATVRDFLAWLTASDALADPVPEIGPLDPDRVEVTTFHKAKGLEWRAVAIVGLEDGIVPIAYATTEDELDEERRLFYVALTRAERELWCSWAESRCSGDREWTCGRSPFLDPVEEVVQIDRITDDQDARLARISELRRCLASAG